MDKVPVNDTVIYAIARLVDDAQSDRRDPSHSDIHFQITRCSLIIADPNKVGFPPVGKAKRVRAVLSWALDNDIEKAERFCAGIISSVKSCGGFRQGSPNYVGEDAILDLSNALKQQNVVLGNDGTISQLALDGLSGKKLTDALRGYVNRAKKGIEDAALTVGNSKDLMEAVSAHVIQEVWGAYSPTANFPYLLGQAFTALGMATPGVTSSMPEHPRCQMERAMYDMACSINKLRNKHGTGHGRPWIPDLKAAEAKSAIEFIGIISEHMLNNLELKKK